MGDEKKRRGGVKNWSTKRLVLLAIVVVLLCVGLAIITWWFAKPHYWVWLGERDFRGTFEYDAQSKLLIVRNETGHEVQRATLGYRIPKVEWTWDDPWICNEGDYCFDWERRGVLSLVYEELIEERNLHCMNVTWQVNWEGRTEQETFYPYDCFDTTRAHWYGGAQVFSQRWPVNNGSGEMQPFITNDYLSWGEANKDRYGSVMERLFVTSEGVGIVIEDDVPLHLSLNASGDGRMCILSNYTFHYPNPRGRLPHMKYSICVGENARQVHEYMYHRYYRQPSGLPADLVLKRPIWSTWARYKKDINQSVVLEMASEIVYWNMSASQVSIDDFWETRYGELHFNETKFPEPKSMFDYFHQKGWDGTVWVHPFTNIDSFTFEDNAAFGEPDYWVSQAPQKATGQPDVPGLTKWWCGTQYAALLDVTNPLARRWFVSRLEELRTNFTIDSFKFDGGEAQYLPDVNYRTYTTYTNPNYYTRDYAEMAAIFGGQTEVRVGYRSQELPVFVRMFDKNSVWGYDNGLRTIIPTALLFSILGYPYILPDMIGGNAYNDQLPDRELYIRWMGISTFMPTMQFSIAPWQYGAGDDEEVIRIARKFLEIHERDVYPQLVTFANEAVNGRRYAPIIRPLWWEDPENILAQTIDDEFLVGDQILVAPIVERGTTTREVYFPIQGVSWQDARDRGRVYRGGEYRTIRVELDEVAYFYRN
ncbi:myogenesis-regulating glycosidase-like [Branchiostoma floridae x Branchiostoma belcheri]